MVSERRFCLPCSCFTPVQLFITTSFAATVCFCACGSVDDRQRSLEQRALPLRVIGLNRSRGRRRESGVRQWQRGAGQSQNVPLCARRLATELQHLRHLCWPACCRFWRAHFDLHQRPLGICRNNYRQINKC
jgi:hypothetical protein